MFATVRSSAAVSHVLRWLFTNQWVVSVQAMDIRHPLLVSVRLFHFTLHVDIINGL